MDTIDDRRMQRRAATLSRIRAMRLPDPESPEFREIMGRQALVLNTVTDAEDTLSFLEASLGEIS